jgi:hypothetical protein
MGNLVVDFRGIDTGDVAGYPPALGGVIAPGLDTCCAPFAETVEDSAVLGFESVAHAIVALGGAAGGPIVARGRQPSVVNTGPVRAGGVVVVWMAVVVFIARP